MSSEKANLRAVADRGACCGYALCSAICPEVFKLDEDGLVYFEDDKVNPELEEAAQEAVESCPAEAIWLEDIKD